ncbi:MAG: hypothetical protein A2Y12_01345 [Planctomycetes bacterium GWF2_42_9]|nr:MAG: hypothetical protein A2Y12_01345 [Planctomycetes bacterium GWF2_42_9]
MTIGRKILMSGIPFLALAEASNTATDEVVTIADQFMKYGELGLCFALVAYLMYSNWSLVQSLNRLLKEKAESEERLVKALQTFCEVCRERPCLAQAGAFKSDNPNGIVNTHTAGGE